MEQEQKQDLAERVASVLLPRVVEEYKSKGGKGLGTRKAKRQIREYLECQPEGFWDVIEGSADVEKAILELADELEEVLGLEKMDAAQIREMVEDEGIPGRIRERK
ncbi:MAG: XRE family transcriptional regulator [Synergistales bacterium]|nr:XRE family transcriptional regulator [Synergistales bacterium]